MTTATTELVVRGLTSLRRSTVWWAIGLGALLLVTAATWPSLEGSGALDSFDELGAIGEAFGATNLGSPAGYLDGQLYAVMLPLLLSGMAIAHVSALTSGDEGAGRLEILHALPLARSAIWLSRLGAALGAVAIVAVVAAAVMVAARSAFSLDEVGTGRIVTATAAAAALAWFHGAVAYAVGGMGAPRGRAVGVSVLVLVGGYVMDFIAPLSETLDVVRPWSPWHWAIGQQPITDGVEVGGIALLVVVTVVLLALGTTAVNRRDIRSS